jgi:hypothetical protein
MTWFGVVWLEVGGKQKLNKGSELVQFHTQRYGKIKYEK